MKTVKTMLLGCLFTAVLFSCEKEDTVNVSNPKSLAIQSVQEETENLQSSDYFTEGAKIGLYLTKGTVNVPYDDESSYFNLPLEYKSGNWNTPFKVYLRRESMSLYAYYPYKEEYTDPDAIPVNLKQPIDLLIGKTGDNQITIENASQNIVMKHALSKTRFIFRKQNFDAPVELTHIKIEDISNSDLINTEALISVFDQTITGREGSTLEFSPQFTITEEEFPSAENGKYLEYLFIPFSQNPTNSDSIKLTFILNGKDYTCFLPSGTLWESGKINTYHINFSPVNLSIESVTVEDWQTGEEEEVDLKY